jgi:hypothetical protein
MLPGLELILEGSKEDVDLLGAMLHVRLLPGHEIVGILVHTEHSTCIVV